MLKDTYGTVLKSLDENAKAHDNYWEYCASNDSAIERWMKLDSLSHMDRPEKFKNFRRFEDAAWDANHPDYPAIGYSIENLAQNENEGKRF